MQDGPGVRRPSTTLELALIASPIRGDDAAAAVLDDAELECASSEAHRYSVGSETAITTIVSLTITFKPVLRALRDSSVHTTSVTFG